MPFGHFIYFLWAPTLCFQLSYPRSPRIRKWFLVKRIAEFCFLVFAQVFVLLQFIYPTLLNAPKVFDVHNINPTEVVTYVGSLGVQTGPPLHCLLADRVRVRVP